MKAMDRSPDERQQIALRDVLWITTAVAFVLGYARTLGQSALMQAVVYATLAVSVGCVVGWVGRNMRDGLFWSAVMALLAYVAVAGGRLPNSAVVIGWGAVGAACGALAGVRLPTSAWLGSWTSAACGLLLMAGCIVVAGHSLSWLLMLDVVAAALIGCLLRPFITFLQWFEQRSRQPRVVLVSWLTLTVVIGNALVPILGGVQR